MCDTCDQIGITDPHREWTPLLLRCATSEVADAFRVILVNIGAKKPRPDGTYEEPFTDDRMVFLPWSGQPDYVHAIAELAATTDVADDDEIQEMKYGALAQAFHVDIDTARTFGQQINQLQQQFRAAIGSAKPVDVDAAMGSLDDALRALLEQAPDPDER
jgi:hypothetical protein